MQSLTVLAQQSTGFVIRKSVRFVRFSPLTGCFPLWNLAEQASEGRQGYDLSTASPSSLLDLERSGVQSDQSDI